VEPGVPESGLRHREMRRPALAPPEYSHPRDPRDGVLSPGAPADPGGGSRVAARALAWDWRALVPATVPRLLAAGARVPGGVDPAAPTLRLRVRDRGRRARRAARADALGGAALQAAPRRVRSGGHHRHRARSRPLERPGVRHGPRL